MTQALELGLELPNTCGGAIALGLEGLENEYKNGEFTRVLKSISGSTMTEFDENGNKVYEGEYDERIENGLKRKGKGKEYEKDGKTLVYVGDWSNGKSGGPSSTNSLK